MSKWEEVLFSSQRVCGLGVQCPRFWAAGAAGALASRPYQRPHGKGDDLRGNSFESIYSVEDHHLHSVPKRPVLPGRSPSRRLAMENTSPWAEGERTFWVSSGRRLVLRELQLPHGPGTWGANTWVRAEESVAFLFGLSFYAQSVGLRQHDSMWRMWSSIKNEVRGERAKTYRPWSPSFR